MSVCRLANYQHMDENELDAMLFGLAVECPFGCAEPCPLTPLRDRPLRERFQEITSMSHAGKLRLMASLVACYRDFEGRKPALQNT